MIKPVEVGELHIKKRTKNKRYFREYKISAVLTLVQTYWDDQICACGHAAHTNKDKY
jgi:hypothetical protein